MTPDSADQPRGRRSALADAASGSARTVRGASGCRKDGRYGYAAYVLTTAGTYKRVQGYARSHEDARRKLTELVGSD